MPNMPKKTREEIVKDLRKQLESTTVKNEAIVRIRRNFDALENGSVDETERERRLSEFNDDLSALRSKKTNTGLVAASALANVALAAWSIVTGTPVPLTEPSSVGSGAEDGLMQAISGYIEVMSDKNMTKKDIATNTATNTATNIVTIDPPPRTTSPTGLTSAPDTPSLRQMSNLDDDYIQKFQNLCPSVGQIIKQPSSSGSGFVITSPDEKGNPIPRLDVTVSHEKGVSATTSDGLSGDEKQHLAEKLVAAYVLEYNPKSLTKIKISSGSGEMKSLIENEFKKYLNGTKTSSMREQLNRDRLTSDETKGDNKDEAFTSTNSLGK